MSTPPSGATPAHDRPGDDSGTGPTPAAGWYPTPTGEQRYWDGTQWLELPPPGQTWPDAPAQPRDVPAKTRHRRLLAVVGALVVLLGLVGGGIAWKVANDERVAEAEAEAAAAEEAAAEEREQRERRERAEAAEEAQAEAQERRDNAERALRRASIPEIEASVKAMADGHVADGLLDGPILEVSCSPVGGGSTDDLTEQTTVFACFAAHRDNGDGTQSGYSYNATMNWSTGQYTYRLGAP
ncbi:hypothetical protein [Blastococcus sp. SYSU D01042]